MECYRLADDPSRGTAQQSTVGTLLYLGAVMNRKLRSGGAVAERKLGVALPV